MICKNCFEDIINISNYNKVYIVGFHITLCDDKLTAHVENIGD